MLLAAAAWILWSTAPADAGLEEEQGTEELVLEAAPGLEGADPLPETLAEEIVRTEMVDPVAALAENIELGYPPERDILVRAELTTVADEQGHPPKACEGWTVVAQTWLSETGEVARFEAVSDAKGIAEFHFPDFIHVDWLTCLPPEGSGYAMGFYEGHDDLGPDDDYLALLHMTPAKGAFGHVVDHQGLAVGGATVHVYDENWTYGLGDWTPGFLTAVTDGSGRFAFDQLPKNDWVFSVEPDRWLMMDPILEHQQEGNGIASIEKDSEEAIDVGVLKVVPMVSLDLQMMGSNGSPAVGASLYLEPLALDDWFVRDIVEANLSEEERAEAIFSSDSSDVLAAFEDLPYSFYFTSDTSGKVTLRLLRGRYRMRVESLPGMLAEEESPPMEFHTDQGNLTYRFPAPLGELRGRVVGSDGSPRPEASVQLSWSVNEDDWDNLDRDCDATGGFVFQSVRLGGEFRVDVWPGHDAWLPEGSPLSGSEFDGDLEITLEPAGGILIDFKMDFLPHRIAYVKILDFTPDGDRGFDPDALWWQRCRDRHFRLKRNNRVNLSYLKPGTYQIALFHSAADFLGQDDKEAGITEIGRWALTTCGEVQRLQVDWPR